MFFVWAIVYVAYRCVGQGVEGWVVFYSCTHYRSCGDLHSARESFSIRLSLLNLWLCR